MVEKICKKCGLKEVLPGVHIDEDGICNLCHDFFSSNAYLNEETERKNVSRRVEDYLKTIRKRSIYDAAVMVSGGKDSSYSLYLLKEKYKLNVLAISIIHPIISQTSQENIDIIAKKLKVDLLKFKIDEDLYKRFVVEGFKYTRKNNYIDKGVPPLANCQFCWYLRESVCFNLAVKLGIPLICAGYDVSIWPPFMAVLSDADKHRFYHNDLWSSRMNFLHSIFSKIFKNKYENTIYDFNLKKITLDRLPAVFHPLLSVKYSRKSIINVLSKKFGLSKKRFNSFYTNCWPERTVFFYQSYRRFNLPAGLFLKCSYSRRTGGKIKLWSVAKNSDMIVSPEEIWNYYEIHMHILTLIAKKRRVDDIVGSVKENFPNWKKFYMSVAVLKEQITCYYKPFHYFKNYFNLKFD